MAAAAVQRLDAQDILTKARQIGRIGEELLVTGQGDVHYFLQDLASVCRALELVPFEDPNRGDFLSTELSELGERVIAAYHAPDWGRSEHEEESAVAADDYVQHEVAVEKNRQRGRPRIVVEQNELERMVADECTLSEMSWFTGASESTIKRRLKECDIVQNPGRRLSEHQIDEYVSSIKREYPYWGKANVQAAIKTRFGVKIRHSKVLKSLHRVDPLGTVARQHSRRLRRRSYSCAGPMDVFHADSNHKVSCIRCSM